MDNFFKYLTITNLEEDWGLYVNTVGHTITKAQQSYPDNSQHPRNHSFTWNNGRILDGYYLIYITKGKGVFESSQTTATEIGAGTCFLLFPGVWHRYKPDPGSGWEEYWMGFKGSYASQLMQKHFFRAEKPFVYTGLNEKLQSCYHRLLETVRFGETGYPQEVAGICLQTLGILYNIAHHHSQQADPVARLINKAKFLLQENLEAEVDMQQLAQQLPMGYSNFRKQFKIYTGESPTQYLLNIRLSKARELLNSTLLSINEIAFHTGFESVYYFSKMFKQKHGVSPTMFRAQEA